MIRKRENDRRETREQLRKRGIERERERGREKERERERVREREKERGQSESGDAWNIAVLCHLSKSLALCVCVYQRVGLHIRQAHSGK